MTNIRDLFSLAGQCAVVIGGTGKIGAPMAEALAEAGARVYIAARKVDIGHPVLSGLAKQELDVHGICLDQSDEHRSQAQSKQSRANTSRRISS